MSARSLRQIVGAPLQLHAGATLDAAKTAVVFIDYQNEYRQGPLALPDEAAASEAARRLRAWADRVGIAVIHVLHHAPATAPIFAPDTLGAAPTYVALHELPAESWGYDGETQAARKAQRELANAAGGAA